MSRPPRSGPGAGAADQGAGAAVAQALLEQLGEAQDLLVQALREGDAEAGDAGDAAGQALRLRAAWQAALELRDATQALLDEAAGDGDADEGALAGGAVADDDDDVREDDEAPPAAALHALLERALVVRALTRQCLQQRREDRSPWRAGLVEVAAAVRDLAERARQRFAAGSDRASALDQRLAAEEEQQLALAGRLGPALTYAAVGPAEPPPSAWSLLGWDADGGRPIALPRDRGQLVLCCGVPGSGKSQAALTQIEAALRPRPGLASRQPPTAVVSFHSDLSGVSLPELLWAALANPRPADQQVLAQQLAASAEGLPRVRLAVPAWLLDEYHERVQAALGAPLPAGLSLVPLRLRLGQLGARGLEALLGAVGDEDDAQYLQLMLRDAEALGDELTLSEWRRALHGQPGLNRALRERALLRLAPLERLEVAPGDSGDVWDLCAPGVLTIFVLGGRWLPRRLALPLVTALMNALSQPGGPHGLFQRFFHLDEVSRLQGDARLWEHVVMTARQQRHWATTLWLLGQDLLGLPDELIALARAALVFRQGSPRLYQHLRQRLPGLRRLGFPALSRLATGEALLCSDFSDPALRGRLRVQVRPPQCAHGGHSALVL